jgi:hypothetical protein
MLAAAPRAGALESSPQSRLPTVKLQRLCYHEQVAGALPQVSQHCMASLHYSVKEIAKGHIKKNPSTYPLLFLPLEFTFT